MPITPDTKNWTWVLERPCPECHFDASTFSSRDVAEMVRSNADAWPTILRHPDASVRPNDTTWSPLEYAAHVRDVFGLFRARLQLMLDEVDPVFDDWDQDETAVRERYGEQDPGTVARELVAAAAEMAALLDSVDNQAWGRTGRRSDGASFTIDTFAKYLIHDSLHHLWDVR
ncbi:DinB family protein [Homoserinimonas aerilata]|uniref:DinB family protein n=1 Tax=Homoserinimonas aerilata TaxID=1162970 RepID=A0A542YEU0_9MICO|nr:DinB family protein [Homoserinimonas aerilata]TQL46598.1 DinB family protein [Homoserinimonas aerilata]